MEWIGPVSAALTASAAVLAGAALVLSLGSRAERLSPLLLAFATGTLLATASLDMLPEALVDAPPERVGLLFLAGVLGSIALEQAMHWRHGEGGLSDTARGHAVSRGAGAVVLWADTLHNAVDGLVLGVAFAADPHLGLSATWAVVVHEIPQEVGDFAVLLATGMSRRRALLLNGLSALAIVPATVVAFATASTAGIGGWLLPIAAASFVYIALADLVPIFLRGHGRKGWVRRFALLLAGALAVGLLPG